MKAICFDRYGGPEELYLSDLPKPEPKPKEILVKIMAASVTAGDTELRRFDFPFFVWPLRLYMGVFRPRKKVLGAEFSGIVEAIGPSVGKFKVGDNVYGSAGIDFGTHQEYRCFSENRAIVLKPGNLSFEEAAGITTGGFNALHFLREAKVSKGDRLLVVGATGSIGIQMVQLASRLGAEVTAVCNRTSFDLIRSLGAAHCIDYTTQNYWELREHYDVVFEAIGKTSFSKAIQATADHGRMILANPRTMDLLKAIGNKLFPKRSVKVITKFAGEPKEDLAQLNQLLESGELKMIVDKVFPLKEARRAHEYVEQREKIGNVILSMVDN